MDEINQIIGGYVERDFNLAYYNGEITGLNVNEGQSPVKVFISQLLSNYIIKEEKQSEIALLKKLKEKMLTVITTNYDNFLEKFVFTNHETIVGQQIFWGNDKGSLLKIHGSISNPSSIVLTDRDYANFEEKSKILSARVMNLFLENPVIFLGYSISDSNIRNLLVDIFSCIESEVDFQLLRKRLIFVNYDDSSDDISIADHSIDVNGTIISMTQVTLNDFHSLLEEMTKLQRTIDLKEIYQLQELVHKIALDYDGDKIKIVNLSKDEDIEGNEVVVAFGLANKVNEILVPRGVTSDDLFKDVICSDVIDIPKEYIVKETLPELFKSNAQLPIHKYVKSLDGIENEKIKQLYVLEPGDFLTNSIKKHFEFYQSIKEKTLEEIFEEDYPVTNKLNLLILRAVYGSPYQEIEAFVKSNFEKVLEFNGGKTYLRKLILIYDKKKSKSTL